VSSYCITEKAPKMVLSIKTAERAHRYFGEIFRIRSILELTLLFC
jgi:hypothetical protein